MRKNKYKKLGGFSSVSRFFILFLIFLALSSISGKKPLYEKYIPSDGYYQKEETQIKRDIQTTRNANPGYDWSVEKVDEHITRVSLPPDPRMSTAEELFEAMNNYRRAHSLSILQKSDLLCSIADNRAKEQSANGKLDGHAGFGKYAEEQNEFSVMGEVLFGGAQPQYGVHIVEFGWDRSLTGHKEAIQDPSWQFGCGGISGYFAVFIFGAK